MIRKTAWPKDFASRSRSKSWSKSMTGIRSWSSFKFWSCSWSICLWASSRSWKGDI